MAKLSYIEKSRKSTLIQYKHEKYNKKKQGAADAPIIQNKMQRKEVTSKPLDEEGIISYNHSKERSHLS